MLKTITKITVLFGLMALTMSSSCDDKDKANADMKDKVDSPTEVKHEGIVSREHAEEGCDYLIKLEEAINGSNYLLPIGLDVKYKKQGLKLKFTYRTSRASSGTCMHGQPAILENIEVIP